MKMKMQAIIKSESETARDKQVTLTISNHHSRDIRKVVVGFNGKEYVFPALDLYRAIKGVTGFSE